jgi:hypothetical protein
VTCCGEVWGLVVGERLVGLEGRVVWGVKKTGRCCDVPESSKEVVEGDGK